MKYADIEDVEAGFRPLTQAEREQCDAMLEEAAVIAAYHSRARDSALVPVDYTIIKNVKKPSGAKPGKVVYDKFETAVVTPDKERVAALLVKG